jgi:hypothetical protein
VITDDLEWLGTWYRNQCDGRWEHQKGMLLEPVASRTRESQAAQASWRLRIYLRGTTAAGAGPRKMALYAMPSSKAGAAQHAAHGNWVRCSMNAHAFEGEGAEVEQLVGVFRRWVGPEQQRLGAAAGV